MPYFFYAQFDVLNSLELGVFKEAISNGLFLIAHLLDKHDEWVYPYPCPFLLKFRVILVLIPKYHVCNIHLM